MAIRFLTKTFIAICLFSTYTIGAIENSIMPLVEKFECLENLPIQKFSDAQYAEISAALQHKEQKIRLVSYNMLFNLYDHKMEVENRWPTRLPLIVELLEEMQPDIIGVQELYTSQYADLLPYLQQAYTFYSRACKDGELNGIFYRKERFEVIDRHVWYMTATPDVPSSETLTMLQLKDRQTGQSVAVFNAHLTFGNINKREFQTQFVAKHIKTFANGLPHIFCGDLNTFPCRQDLAKLPFYDGDHMHRILTKSGALKDAKEVSLLGHLGPIGTFSNQDDSGTPFKGTGTPGVMLDHIYVSAGINVLMHAVQPGKVNGLFPSDHFPILIDFLVE